MSNEANEVKSCPKEDVSSSQVLKGASGADSEVKPIEPERVSFSSQVTSLTAGVFEQCLQRATISDVVCKFFEFSSKLCVFLSCSNPLHCIHLLS